MTVLLASGGLDSTLLAAEFGPSIHLTIDYGQPHAREIDAARAIAAHYGAEHIIMACDLPAVGALPEMIVPGRNLALIALARGRCVVLLA